MARDPRAELLPKLREAVERALAGDWQAAHQIVQEHEDDADASWIHAVVHRMEGDLDNARYWYGRCRRELREGVSTEAELREIRAALAEPGGGREP
jgi:hypothetical protein